MSHGFESWPVPEPRAPETGIRADLRHLLLRDYPEILAIELESSPFPWDEDRFHATLRERNHIGHVAEYAGRVVGFCVFALRDRYLTLLNIAVAPRFRRMGVGAAMAARLLNRLDVKGRTSVELLIRETNMDGIRFFRRQGFRGSAVLREFYGDTGEDAYVMLATIEDLTEREVGSERDGRVSR